MPTSLSAQHFIPNIPILISALSFSPKSDFCLYRESADNQLKMSQPESQARRDDSEWVTHKETIRNLFLKENKYLRGADGVVETMERLYGFHKSYALLQLLALPPNMIC
jgi:hypothetical protein